MEQSTEDPKNYRNNPNSFVTTSSKNTIIGYLNQRIRWSSNSKFTLKSSPLFFAFLLISSFAIGVTFLAVLWKFSPDLPGYDKIVNYKPNLSSRLYSSDGVLLKSFHKEERLFIPIERIPKNIIYAFISVSTGFTYLCPLGTKCSIYSMQGTFLDTIS